MNNIAQNFLSWHDEKSAIDILRLARCQNFHNIGVALGNFLVKEFPNSFDIRDEYGIMLYYSNKHAEAYFTFNKLLALRCLNQEKTNYIIFNQHFCIDSVKNRYIHYEPNRIRSILNRKKRIFPLVTFTITTCKRWDLFFKSINSFINCCKDIELIDEWFCIDDNSSEEDRNKMQQFYPFFKFYFKKIEEKGHPQSMNIIRKIVKTPYTFHMEDDWQFFERRNYLSECLEVLGQDSKFGQCLINKNYAEVASDQIKGGIFKITASGLRYYIHEFVNTEEKLKAFIEKHGNGNSCNYWPHYSLRPSLLRTKIFEELGAYEETKSHFEMDYSLRYINKGYVSVFLEKLYCIHIGRLTSEMDNKEKLNAYDLNDEAQFYGKEEKLENKNFKTDLDFTFKFKTFVINLDSRTDRWAKFCTHFEPKFLVYNRFSAIDGKKLKPNQQLSQIFDHNDYNMRQGIVGCALSHIKLYIQLLQDKEVDVYLLLEDDLNFVPDFQKKLIHCVQELQGKEWDILYLGHHLKKEFIDDKVYSKNLFPKIEQFNRAKSLERSFGGTIAYMINKKGVEKFLNYINKTGMTNGIDTVQQKSADTLNVFYAYPHLVYSKFLSVENLDIDTDIQFNYDSLTLPLDQRFEEELKHYDSIKKVENLENMKEMMRCEIIEPFYYRSEIQKEIQDLSKECNHPHYTLDDHILFVCPDENNGRYFHRFKKYGQWSIDDAIQYK